MRKSVFALFVPVLLFLGLMVLPSPGQAVTNAANRRVGTTAEPTALSIQVSQEFFKTAKTLDTVVVARNDVFADNLGGSALAGAVKGALLLTDGGSAASLRPEVLTEINRLLKPVTGACTLANTDVFILGGTAAVSAKAEASIKAAGWCVTRLGGANRVATALEISKTVRARSNTFDNAFVARSDNPADSASGGALGGRNGIPIVVTPTATLDPSVESFLFDSAPFNKLITLLGGEGALSVGVLNRLSTLAAQKNPATKIDRLSGSARDGTAAKIADRYLATETAAGRPAGNVNVVIVNGFDADGWVYALTAGAVSWQENIVVLYVKKDTVPTATCVWLATNRPSTVITVGPTSKVSDATKTFAQNVASSGQGCGTTIPTTTTPVSSSGCPGVLRTLNFTVPAGPTGLARHLEPLFTGEVVTIEASSTTVDVTLEVNDPSGRNRTGRPNGEIDDFFPPTPETFGPFTLDRSGRWEIVMRDFSGAGGPVQLKITLASPCVSILVNEDVSPTQSAPNGCFEFRTVTLTAGKKVTVAGEALNSIADPYVEVQRNGVNIAQNSTIDAGSKNAQLTFTVPTTGSYNIFVVDNTGCPGDPIKFMVTST